MSLGQGNLLNNRYRIVEILGRGGMGAVYRAVDESLGVDVAVKENLFTTDDYARQFRMEAVILAGIRHPNLPRVTDHFVLEEQGQYLVMDYIEGDDLRQRIEKQGTLNEAEAIRIGAAVCDALTYLHTRKPPILHRDIKLGNVKLVPDGNVVLVDFGLAKQAWEHEETMTGARAMTPGYSPPEQYGSARTDARSDVYSLGATLYAAITGVVPEDSLMRAVDGVELTPLRKHKPSITPRLAAVIEKAMEPIPANRYQSAAEFKAALLGIEDDTGRLEDESNPASSPRMPQETESKPAPPRKKKGGCFSLFLLVLLLTLAVSALIVFDPKNQQFVLSFIQTEVFTPTFSPAVPATLTLTPEMTGDTATEPTATTQTTNTPTPTRTSLPSPTPTATTEAAAVVPPSPTPVGGTGEIAYAMIQNRIAQIYLANADGTNIRQLTNDVNGACNFDWSPDGKQLVYVSPCGTKSWQYSGAGLRILDLETGNSRSLLEKPSGEFDPAWSPDGKKIAFTSMRDETWQIYVIDLETSALTQLTTYEETVQSRANNQSRHPVWSPDGKQLAYVARRGAEYQLWTMNASDGSDKKRLVYTVPTVSDYLPAWSPDGTFILFSQANLDLTTPSVLMRLNIGMQQAERIVKAGAPVVDVNFSPDGFWIAYESTDTNNQDVFLFNLLTGERVRLTTSPNVEFDPAWRP
jgi:serine/threonine protein kinase/Tol biopolymer transport system component